VPIIKGILIYLDGATTIMVYLDQFRGEILEIERFINVPP